MTEEKKLNGYDIIQQILPQVSSLYFYALGLELVPQAIDVAEPVNRMRHFPFGDYCTSSSLG